MAAEIRSVQFLRGTHAPERDGGAMLTAVLEVILEVTVPVSGKVVADVDRAILVKGDDLDVAAKTSLADRLLADLPAVKADTLPIDGSGKL